MNTLTNQTDDPSVNHMQMVIGSIMDVFDRASEREVNRSAQTDLVARKVEDLGNAKGIIAEWGARRRDSDGDVGTAIEAIQLINVMSAFMIVVEQKMPGKFASLYCDAKDLVETGFTSAATEIINAMDTIDWEEKRSKEVK